jgi:hypothetical protein
VARKSETSTRDTDKASAVRLKTFMGEDEQVEEERRKRRERGDSLKE